MNYKDWIIDGLKVFFLIFVIGKGINFSSKRLQEYLQIKRSKIYGLFHLFFILTFSYYLHILTSDKFSEEMGISNPSILFSGLFMGLQSNMFYNLGV